MWPAKTTSYICLFYACAYTRHVNRDVILKVLRATQANPVHCTCFQFNNFSITRMIGVDIISQLNSNSMYKQRGLINGRTELDTKAVNSIYTVLRIHYQREAYLFVFYKRHNGSVQIFIRYVSSIVVLKINADHYLHIWTWVTYIFKQNNGERCLSHEQNVMAIGVCDTPHIHTIFRHHNNIEFFVIYLFSIKDLRAYCRANVVDLQKQRLSLYVLRLATVYLL